MPFPNQQFYSTFIFSDIVVACKNQSNALTYLDFREAETDMGDHKKLGDSDQLSHLSQYWSQFIKYLTGCICFHNHF